MAVNLLDTLKDGWDEDIAAAVAGHPGATTSAMAMILPWLIGGLADHPAASDFLRTLPPPGKRGDDAGGDTPESAGSAGHRLVERLFGERVTFIVGTIAAGSGLDADSAAKLLDLAAPGVFERLQRWVVENGLKDEELSGLLATQRDALFGVVAAGSVNPCQPEAVNESGAVGHGGSLLGRLLPWLVVLVGLVAAVALYRSVRQPGDRAVTPESSAESPARAAAGSPADAVVRGALPAVIRFTAGSASVGSDGEQAIAAVAVAATQAGAALNVTGYGDPPGDAAASVVLAKQRAVAVRQRLVAAGLPESRIHMQPPARLIPPAGGTEVAAHRVDITLAD